MWEEIYLDNLSMGSQLLAIHYEQFKENPKREMAKIMDAIEVDYNPKRLDCFASDTRDQHRRTAKAYPNPYTQELTDLFMAAIGRVQDMLTKRGLELMPVHKYKWAPKFQQP